MRRLSAIGLVWLLAACGSDGDGSGADGGSDGATGSDSMPVGDAGADGWATLPDVGLGPIQEISVVALGTDVYVIGGFTQGLATTGAVQRFDTTTQSWSEVASLPVPVHHANAAAVNGKLYVLGTLVDGLSFTAVGDAWEYDPALDMWTDIAAMPVGTERGASAVGVVNGDVCLAGGLRGGSVADFSCYDPVGDSWTVLPSVPTANDHLVGGVVDDRFFIIGGRAGGITGVFDEVYEWVPPAGEWQARAPMPTARGGGAAGVVSGAIVVVGGEGNTAVPSGVFPQVESYDPVADEWTSLGEMRTPRHGMGAAAIGGTLYVPGGADEQAFGAVATFESFTP